MVFCRPIGFDIAEGEKVLSAGERLGPPELGLLAAVGVTQVSLLSCNGLQDKILTRFIQI